MNESPPAPGSAPESLDAAALQPGARIDEYTIVQVLGVGGFGITYLARDGHLELTVALKEYFPVQLATRVAGGEVQPRSREPQVVGRFQTGLQRFVAEARALATFRHPNIVRVLRYFEAQGTACIVMEYETGQSLRRWMKSKPPLTQDAVLALIRPLLDGLEAVHAAGFLHRDIKPDNIFVRSSGSPVLLDFGAARRVCAGTDLTNIVSPGFAPFEQYHTRGRQGPWTDIYSIGAVMYWMATREKPLDAASRVKIDTMPRLADLADRSEFDPAVVRVIDWALELEEKRRPQSVAELRAALDAPIDAGAGTVLEQPTEALPPVATPPPDAPPFSVACGRRNILCTILFLDLVGYTTLPVDEQVAAKQLTNRLIAHAVQPIAPEQRLAIDTGDGAAICFVADPQRTLDVALTLRRLLHQQGRPRLRARMGLHLGPVRIVSDINDRRNVVGDGINVAQRVMDFAQPDQLLVSSAFHDAMLRTCDTAPGLFRYAGPFQDKHGRVHEVHSINAPPGLRLAAFCPEPPAPNGSDDGVPSHDADEVAEELSRLVGPMARLLVDKARRRFSTPQGLRQGLAFFILETAARAEFLGELPDADAPEHSSLTARLAPRPQSDIAPRLRSITLPTPTVEVMPPPVQVAPSVPGAAPDAPPLVRRSGQPLDKQTLVVLERVLGQHIGPLAKVLLVRERDAGLDGRALIHALAGHLAGTAQKEAFLRSVHREIRRISQ